MGFPKPKILKDGCTGNRLIWLLFQENYFQRQLKWNDRYFRIRKRNFLTKTHLRTHTPPPSPLPPLPPPPGHRNHTPSTVHVSICLSRGFAMFVVMLCTLSTSIAYLI